MAKQVPFRVQSVPAAEETQRKLDAAPLAHAEAVLNAFRTLQILHDTHTLDFVRGLLGAGDEVLSQVVSVATSPQSTRAIRNLLILTNLLGSIDPDTLHRITSAVTTDADRTPAGRAAFLVRDDQKALLKRLAARPGSRACGAGRAGPFPWARQHKHATTAKRYCSAPQLQSGKAALRNPHPVHRWAAPAVPAEPPGQRNSPASSPIEKSSVVPAPSAPCSPGLPADPS